MRLDEIKFAVAMVKKGYNTVSLAQACGVSRATLSAAKAGKRIKADTVLKIAKVLEVEMEDLLED
jgi:DNA-binding Xre family transcriptional regulator